MTYKDWRIAIRRSIWVSPGEPKNQVQVHNDQIDLAMTDLSKFVKCVQPQNTNVYRACRTYVRCAMSMLELPVGFIRSVSTIANDEWCDRVYYERADIAQIQCRVKTLGLAWTAPTNVGMTTLPQGIKFAEASTDSPYGRARVGIWAIERAVRLVMFPWIQSNESVVVEWDGAKKLWSEDDILDLNYWTNDYREAVKTYVRWKHEDQFGCDPGEKIRLENEYRKQLADLMWECDARLMQPIDTPSCSTAQLATQAELDDDAVPVVTEEINFAIIGDYGMDNANELAVSSLIHGWNPEFILTAGDNNYLVSGDYDLAVGKYFQDYIFPYAGAFGSGSATGENRFFPIPSNHDYDSDGPGATTLAKFLAFFTLPNNERYYELVRGPVHFFMLNSDPREPNGNTSASQQAEWLRAKLVLSTATWKIVVLHDPPYTSSASGDSPGILSSRWPFKTWGAHAVISGDQHHYERLAIDGLPYIVNGAGSASVDNFVAPIAGSQVRYNEAFGAMKCKATCEKLTFEFYNVSGVLIDTLELTK